jgi:putative transposase
MSSTARVEFPGFGGELGCRRRGGRHHVHEGGKRASSDYLCVHHRHRKQHSVQEMCRVLGVAPSGDYHWLKQPLSNRAEEDARLLKLIRASFVASHEIRGATSVPRSQRGRRDLQQALRRSSDARASAPCVARLSYATDGGRQGVRPDPQSVEARVHRHAAQQSLSDGHHLHSHVAGLDLAVVMNLFSRKIVGWATAPTIHREVVLNAVLMGVRARRPRGTVIHSDPGTQFGSDAWRRFCRSNRLEPSMSRKGNCWDTQSLSGRIRFVA